MTQSPTIHLHGSHDIEGKCLFGPVELTLPAGQWTCVLGRSGVGKSTLLRLIAGLPCAGSFDGRVVGSDGEALAGRISIMAQSDLLLPWLNVLENTVIGARLRGQKPDLQRARTLLDRVGLSGSFHKKPNALSGGMRQRAALARTIMEDRPIVLLDEPFSALDASTRAEMQELSAEVFANRTVLLVTHDPAEAARLAHQIVVLTPDAAEIWPTPGIAPVRDQYDPATVGCQAKLLAYLRQMQ